MAVGVSHNARRVRKAFPAVLMRAGTSRGLFIQRQYLPEFTADWAPQLLAAMGSADCDKRQIDGVGGATSTTSKVAVVGVSQLPGIDVEYTFVQVAVGSAAIDLSGSCGNMASGVGPFAVQEGMVKAEPGATTVDVRILNTNTERVIVETVQLNEFGDVEEDGDFKIAGAQGSGSEIKVSFVEPAGSMTDKLFPTGQRREIITADDPDSTDGATFSVEATLIDVANPFILVDIRTMPDGVRELNAGSEKFMRYAEAIRKVGAVRMGLAKSVEAAALVRGTPKVAMALAPVVDEQNGQASDANIQAFSMGKPHPTLQITGAVCIAASVSIPGTVTARLRSGTKSSAAQLPETPLSMSSASSDGEAEDAGPRSDAAPRKVTVARQVIVQHPTGTIEIEAQLTFGGGKGVDEEVVVDKCTVSRTARRIFEGKVLYYAEA
ncbi:PrpF protein-domain-containing protein [Microdochium trichocladiopsis]|uniref:PrpF protein-domain-containing protein n=1 Tax=Microdochium trichocladiopsis TaxID=1682393 RepID=A0A9P9BP67_9PEZI|nr:PrpF protein-domain-containing protein [Microdochium trichocladiopsis]KAH7028959.1 PrpF protein-domain-containing protein [Microdochium trichocladiopsis]